MIKQKILTIQYYEWDAIEHELNRRLQKDIGDYYEYYGYQKYLREELSTTFNDNDWYTVSYDILTKEQLKIHDIYNRRLNDRPKYCCFWDWWIVAYSPMKLCKDSYISLQIQDLKYNYIQNTDTSMWIQEILTEFVKIFEECNEEHIFIHYNW